VQPLRSNLGKLQEPIEVRIFAQFCQASEYSYRLEMHFKGLWVAEAVNAEKSDRSRKKRSVIRICKWPDSIT
jgi:hypothetical protein